MEPRRPQRDTRPVIPRNPFEMQATKELVNKRIESGVFPSLFTSDDGLSLTSGDQARYRRAIWIYLRVLIR